MKAIRIHRFGGPEVLQLDELPTPDPGEGEALVRVRAASINPVDYKMRKGGYPRLQEKDLPKVLGRDLAGVVERLGPGVEGLSEGDEIMVHLDWDRGGYTQMQLVKPNECARKPAGLGWTEAGGVGLAADTAWQGLFDHGRLKDGERVLIHGGSGGVGHLAVQFAKAVGAYVFATAGPDNQDFLRELGADRAIDYKHERFEDIARDIDLVFDMIGGETQDRSYAVLKRGGRLISTLAKPDENKCAEHGVGGANYMARPSAENLAEVARLIEAGQVRVMVSRTFPLEEAGEAQRFTEDEHPRGKVVLETS